VKILIADDEPNIRESLKKLLALEGIERSAPKTAPGEGTARR
jgi:DNA-binding response OmpR family regulator